jgi:L,D-transpeptidase catalytic domain
MSLRLPSILCLLLTCLQPVVTWAAAPATPRTDGGWQSGPTLPASNPVPTPLPPTADSEPPPPAAAAGASTPVAAPAAADGGWQSGPGAAAAPSGPPVAAGPALSADYAPADKVLVLKSERVLRLLNRGRTVAEYPVRLGLNPRGHKQREGDFRTPEGVYSLSRRNPRSEFFLSLEVSYPNEADRRRARANGHAPGGLIMIHGQPNLPRKPAEYYARNDWTDGCIAVSNSDMVDIWLRAPLGIPVEIRP